MAAKHIKVAAGAAKEQILRMILDGRAFINRNSPNDGKSQGEKKETVNNRLKSARCFYQIYHE